MSKYIHRYPLTGRGPMTFQLPMRAKVLDIVIEDRNVYLAVMGDIAAGSEERQVLFVKDVSDQLTDAHEYVGYVGAYHVFVSKSLSQVLSEIG